MKTERIEKAVELAEKIGSVYVATADSNGTPHIAAAGKVELLGQESLAVTEWFCPGTIANLQENKCISLVVWDDDSDTGYQMIGQLQGSHDVGILDGFYPKLESQTPLPQVETQLLIQIEKVIDFRLGPHSDLED